MERLRVKQVVLGLLSLVPALVRISSGSPVLPMACSQASTAFLTAFHSFIEHLSLSLKAKLQHRTNRKIFCNQNHALSKKW